MKNLVSITLLFALLFSSCKQYYEISNFEEVTASHTQIAILPFEIITFGQANRDLTPEMIEEIENLESTSFQSNFFNKVLRSTRRGSNQLSIGLQHYSETNSILEENGISLRDSWSMSPQKLAKLLGVDAVVKSRIEKEQYFSDALSAGIDITQSILTVLLERNPVAVSDVNKEVLSDYAIVDSDGVVLWSIGYRNAADWQVQADQLVTNINHRSARHFPYRDGR